MKTYALATEKVIECRKFWKQYTLKIKSVQQNKWKKNEWKQCWWQNCKKYQQDEILIFIAKSQMKTCINTQAEENKVTFGHRETVIVWK